MKFNMSMKRLVLTSIVFMMLISLWSVQPSQAAVPTLDTIRVGMFMQLPGKYTATTPAATFHSNGGLSIGVREPDGEKGWFTVPAKQNVRFALDDFKVTLLESNNFGAALAVYQYIMSLKGSAYLTSSTKNGIVQFQVSEGAYATFAEGKTAVSRWSADPKLASIITGFKPVLRGPLYLETSQLKNKAEAEATVNAYGAAGLNAFISLRQLAIGELAFSVMVGAATTEEELAQIKAAAINLPNGSSLKAVAKDSRHMLLLNDHSLSAKESSLNELYLFPNNSMKVWISPAGSDTIGLLERSKRTYRGQFELSTFNGKLAVINELPFEQYLYSVVAVEMYSSWPIEALKAQAVAARSYALNKGFGFQIAHVVDTTLSQAYYGAGVEKPTSTEAVNATAGEVALYNGKVIEAVFSSNGGGQTADASDVWKNAIPYLKSVKSPDDSSQVGLLSWYQIVLPSGLIGYIREDLATDTGRKTAAGSRILALTTDNTNIRRHPIIQDTIPVVAKLPKGSEVVVLKKVIESNPMNWIRGPFTDAELLTTINARVNPKIAGTITSIEVSKRGISGRANELTVNGQKLTISSPDSIRSILGHGGSLPSTLFEIEETGKLVVQGTQGLQSTRIDDSKKLYVMGAGGKSAALTDKHVYVLDGNDNVRAATKDPAFQFNGTGFGHGVGLSQYGALSLAKQGYDYQYILKYYYNGITIAKE
ncbi:SpoIID/LytB domain-containing protein [Paenibacillus sp. GSMTC-2017]|uniref:SpoIID/LytB domain-containing protein n=1 Tax=Paenibacillus sp. GSMTC-2017 TaxID=2794350 RepID=UPI0018D6261C|nr:SpoIID/LytB domain-containing protein [Paenibacillus sp. GSMTC-2017]MBH5317132.1 SpoIID/LytB domain-containing protein [Paenibacillus sp. GSMTC-2017]